jgi:hypothetical protein
MPSADRFTVGIMAMLAQKVRELISERTKPSPPPGCAAALDVGSARVETERLGVSRRPVLVAERPHERYCR